MGVMIDKKRVTWTASAILAMFDLQQLGMMSTSFSPVSKPTVETCFMELRSLLVGAPQGDFRNSKGSEALIGQMSVFGLHLSILLTPFSGLHITYNR